MIGLIIAGLDLFFAVFESKLDPTQAYHSAVSGLVVWYCLTTLFLIIFTIASQFNKWLGNRIAWVWAKTFMLDDLGAYGIGIAILMLSRVCLILGASFLYIAPTDKTYASATVGGILLLAGLITGWVCNHLGQTRHERFSRENAEKLIIDQNWEAS